MATPMRMERLLCNRQFCTLFHQMLPSSRKGALVFATRDFTGSTPILPADRGTDEEGFRILAIPGLHPAAEGRKRREPYKRPVDPPREAKMDPNQDWTHVWPTAATFNPSVIPLPIRQGFSQHAGENKGVTPYKYHNTELLKIPNFFHLTPHHIRKHCAAIRKFCTPWPADLSTDDDCDRHFPVTVMTHDYILAGPSLRDPRARVVTTCLNMSSLELDDHAQDKLCRLLGDRFNPETGEITLVSERCPLRQQNHEHGQYLLTALYFESWKFEEWEKEMTWADQPAYKWQISQSKARLKERANKFAKLAEVGEATIERYATAIEQLHNEGENEQTLSEYKQSVKMLLSASG